MCVHACIHTQAHLLFGCFPCEMLSDKISSDEAQKSLDFFLFLSISRASRLLNLGKSNLRELISLNMLIGRFFRDKYFVKWKGQCRQLDIWMLHDYFGSLILHFAS